MQSKKRVFAAVLAVLLAVLGIGSLVLYTKAAQDRAFEGTETVSVLRVTDMVPAGTKASDLDNKLERVKLPRAAVPDDVVTNIDALGDRVTTSTLVSGEVLVGARFTGSRALKGSGAIEVPKGLQEVTISVDATRALGGSLQPGDLVGVLASYEPTKTENFITNFAVNKVLVLAVEGAVPTGDAAAAPGGLIQVRLALASDNVEKVVHASEFGKVWLSRQNDGAKTARKVVTSEDVVK